MPEIVHSDWKMKPYATNSIFPVYIHIASVHAQVVTTFTIHTPLPPPHIHTKTHTHTYPHSKNVVLNYSDAEAKVREATSNDPWGPSSALMSELSEYTFHV